MTALIRSEIIKLRTTRTALGLFIVVILLSVVPELLYGLLVSSGSSRGEWTTVVAASIQFASLFGLIFGILGITGEYRYGTITYTYLTAPRRGRVVVAKLLVYAVFGIALMLVSLVVANAVLAGVFAVRGLSLQPIGGELAGYGRQVIAAGLMTALGVALGAVIRNQVLAVAGTLIWLFVLEGAIGLLRPTVAAFMPFTAINTVTSGPLSTTGDKFELSSPEAFVVVLAWIAVFSVAALFTTLRRDVT